MDRQQKIIIKDKLKDKKHKHLHNNIYIILSGDNNFKYTSNMSCLYFDVNILDVCTLDKLTELLNIPIEKNKNYNIAPNILKNRAMKKMKLINYNAI